MQKFNSSSQEQCISSCKPLRTYLVNIATWLTKNIRRIPEARFKYVELTVNTKCIFNLSHVYIRNKTFTCKEIIKYEEKKNHNFSIVDLAMIILL